MRYPKLYDIPCSREITNTFGGYNHKLRIADGEFYDMQNLSSDHYPVLATRPKRGVIRDLTKKITGMIAKDKLYYLAGGDLYAIGEDSPIAELGLSGDEQRSLISMGAKILIYPDHMFVDISSGETGNFGDKVVYPQNNVTTKEHYLTPYFWVSPCTEDGEEIIYKGQHSGKPLIWGATERYYDDGDTIYNTRDKMLYTVEGEEWVENGVPCFRLNQPQKFGSNFEINDEVVISGFGICEIEIQIDLKHFNQTTAVVGKKGYDPIFKYVGDMSKYGVGCHCNLDVRVNRLSPKRDLVIENGNRLWGCLYGQDFGGFRNTIFASALGSADRWNTNDGTSMDSYYVNVGTDGAFTGSISYAGKPTFFKDGCMHIIYGEYPENYSIQTLTCDGVQAGCDKSLVIIDSILYYKSRNGIYAYDGSFPVKVSEPIGDMSFYEDAVACGIGQKYYISLLDSRSGKRVLYVLDTAKSLWHKEDCPGITQLATHKGEVYFTATSDNTKIYTLLGSGTPENDMVKWFADTGMIGVTDPDRNYISRIDVRVSLEVGAKARFFIQYDSSGEWEFLFAVKGTSLRSFSIPIRPKRCDHMRLRIDGEGGMKMFSICKNIEKGSDI